MDSYRVTTLRLPYIARIATYRKLLSEHLNSPEHEGWNLHTANLHLLSAPPYWTLIWTRVSKRDNGAGTPSSSD